MRTPNLRDVMRDVALLERDQHRIEHGIHREMLFASDQPCRGIVETADRCGNGRT